MNSPSQGPPNTSGQRSRREEIRRQARDDASQRVPETPPIGDIDRIARFLIDSPHWSRRDQISWLLAWTRAAGLSRSMQRLFLEEVDLSAQIQRKTLARAAYRQALDIQLPGPVSGAPPACRGWWAEAPDCTPETLLAAVTEALDTTPPIKKSPHTAVYRVDILGHSACVKVFHPRSWFHRLRHRRSPSPGHHSWAVSCMLGHLAIRCPRPLGWLESHNGKGEVRSWFISEWMDQGHDASRWFKRNLRQHPPALRQTLAREIRDRLFALYDNGCYHADTKTSNMLLHDPDNPTHRQWYWIDLDVLSVDTRITLRRQIRNLVQLNGSIDRQIDRAERLRYLRLFAQRNPRLAQPAVARHIEKRTRQRLAHERDSRCGS